MNQIRIATQNDLHEIKTLLETSDLQVKDIPSPNQKFYVYQENHKITGAIAIEGEAKNGLLRSFAVDQNFRNKGIGKALYDFVLQDLTKSSFQNLYLLTTTAENYFFNLGWIYINKENVPEELQNTAEFSEICPSSAACMFLSLKENSVKKALHFFLNNLNCSQSVFAAYAENLGFDEKKALMLSTGFGGGIAGTGNICGAVTGAYMTIGLRYGKSNSEDDQAKQKTMEVISAFNKKFIERNGSLRCNDLLNSDMQDKKAKEKLITSGAFDKVCPRFIKDACEILNELL